MAQAKLAQRCCRPVPKGTPALTDQQTAQYLQEVPNWKLQGGALVRELKFQNYYQTMAMAVATAMLAQSEDHHPDMHVSYNRLIVSYSTHSVGGLSENDFICAAKVEGLIHAPGAR